MVLRRERTQMDTHCDNLYFWGNDLRVSWMYKYLEIIHNVSVKTKERKETIFTLYIGQERIPTVWLYTDTWMNNGKFYMWISLVLLNLQTTTMNCNKCFSCTSTTKKLCEYSPEVGQRGRSVNTLPSFEKMLGSSECIWWGETGKRRVR